MALPTTGLAFDCAVRFDGAMSAHRSRMLRAVLALALIGSLWPMRRRLLRPGPELHADQHQELFRELRRVAAMTGGVPPNHVFLLAGADTYVRAIGGVFGVGRGRVM